MTLSLLLALAAGVFAGGVVGALVTGDWVYTIVWAVAMAVAITLATLRGLRPRPGGAAIRRLMPIAVLLIAAVATTVPAWGSISRAVQSVAVGDWDGTNLVTGRFQQDAVDAVAEIVGGYEFTQVAFHDTYLVVDAPTTPGASTTDTYLYRYGRAWREGPELIQPSDLQAALFDASRLDFRRVGEAARLALESTELTRVDAYALVALDPANEVAGPIIAVYLSGDYGSASFVYDFDLQLVRQN